MPKYSWSELNEYPVTPAHSSAVARVIPGYQILVLKHLYAANRPDGRIGANMHCHPEEMFCICTMGECDFREEGGDWFTLRPGDVHYIPPYVMHEARSTSDKPFEFIAVKNFINGHSVHDGGWQPGAEEAWKKVVAAYEETKVFANNDPWFKDWGLVHRK